VTGSPVGSGVAVSLGSGVGEAADGTGVGIVLASGDGTGLLGGALLGAVVRDCDGWLAGVGLLAGSPWFGFGGRTRM